MTTREVQSAQDTRTIENAWITLSDGCRLAASVWLPEDTETTPVPAILEYLPYRKDDGRTVRDSTYYPYFAQHGYAGVRVDMRGTGTSEGVLYDEYLPQEQDDALEVIDWIAAQSWCDGNIGMMGISWGGFNALQVAARRPIQLKAIISTASTDDRYADDVHYRGGCLLASDMLEWASRMFAWNGLPPDPRLVGERWREMWFERLRNTPPYVNAWVAHQARDAFWKQGSVCERYEDITCPVYVVGGWADAYTNAVPRLLAGLTCPRKGLIGPWAHAYPNLGIPGPRIGFLQECLRWWDQWLKGIDTGIMDEPMLRAWIQDSLPPAPYYEERPGRWVVEDMWPTSNVEAETCYLNAGTLDEDSAPSSEVAFRGSHFAGAQAGIWCPYGDPADLPPDQRSEDGLSLTFDSKPLTEAIDLLGYPKAILTLSSDQPQALVVVRLCDVAPSGASALVSRGFLNLSHRESHERPRPLEPGRFYAVTIQLDVCGYQIPAGHRWRLALSPTYWPMAWPSPEVATLTLRTGQASRLELPVRRTRSEDADLTIFEQPVSSPPLDHERERPSSRNRLLQYDVAKRSLEIRDVLNDGQTRLSATGLEMFGSNDDTYTILEDDPLSARICCRRITGLRRDQWRVRIETTSTMSADAQQFFLTNTLDAYEGDTRVFAKVDSIQIPRQDV